MARGKKPKDEEHKPEEQPAREPTPEEIKDCPQGPGGCRAGRGGREHRWAAASLSPRVA